MDKEYSSRPETVRVQLSEEVTRHVLWHFGDRRNGWEPGGFTTKLLAAMGASDGLNRAKLALGFPEYVTAFDLVTQQPWGLEYLIGLVKASDADLENQFELFAGGRVSLDCRDRGQACSSCDGCGHECHQKPTLLCEWFAGCTRLASGRVAHPVLGSVPTCVWCAGAHGLTFIEAVAS